MEHLIAHPHMYLYMSKLQCVKSIKSNEKLIFREQPFTSYFNGVITVKAAGMKKMHHHLKVMEVRQGRVPTPSRL